MRVGRYYDSQGVGSLCNVGCTCRSRIGPDAATGTAHVCSRLRRSWRIWIARFCIANHRTGHLAFTCDPNGLTTSCEPEGIFLMFTKRDLLRSTAAIAAGAAIAKPSLLMAQSYPGIIEAKAIAEEGFIYGLPIVMNYAVMYEYAVDKNSGQFKAPFNQIKNEPNVYTYKDTAIVTPNSDTPYSFVWMDLRAEPVVLSVPAIDPKRYYSVMLCDGNTYNYGYIGTRATGSGAGDYMVVGPDWKGDTPAGIKRVFRSSTQFSLAGYRTQLFGQDDLDGVKKVQAGYKVQMLSAYLK